MDHPPKGLHVVTPEELFDDYAFYRYHTKNYRIAILDHGMRPLAKSKKRLDQFGELIAFCEIKGVNPRLYLFSLFAGRFWNFAPRLDQLVPASKKTATKSLDRVKNLRDLTLYRERLAVAKLNAGESRQFDPNVDISPSVEAIKQRYQEQGLFEECIAKGPILTLGFHPKSKICQRCLFASRCTEIIQKTVKFDIIALRSGKITVDTAKRASGVRSQNAAN